MRVVDIRRDDAFLTDALTELSFAAAARHAPNWLPTLERARATVLDATDAGHIARVLQGEDGVPLGWVAAEHTYSAVWEIHPLLVGVEHHGRGYGTRLVADIESRIEARGGAVAFVSTSDETESTSLSNVDLYRDPAGALAALDVQPGHALGFWRRVGYTVVGMIPDAEGPGMPSIHLCKRLG